MYTLVSSRLASSAASFGCWPSLYCPTLQYDAVQSNASVGTGREQWAYRQVKAARRHAKKARQAGSGPGPTPNAQILTNFGLAGAARAIATWILQRPAASSQRTAHSTQHTAHSAPHSICQHVLVPGSHCSTHHLAHAAHDGGHAAAVSAAAEGQQEAAGSSPAGAHTHGWAI